MNPKGFKMSDEVEAAIKKKYEAYCSQKYRTQSNHLMSYEKFKAELLKKKVALF